MMQGMSAALARFGSCALLASLAGCVIDRGELVPSVEAGPPDARVIDEDAPVMDEDTGVIDGDAADRVDAGEMSATCGDGALTSAEACDDGNAIAGDGCDPSCGVESGFACTGAPSRCSKTCGDGRVEASEACDDGNLAPDDGCSPVCVLETGFACSGEPSLCATTCGDSTTAGREECDDGNLDDGDGCGASCLFETTRRVRRGPGLALAIPDDTYVGTLATMTCVDFDVRPFPLDTVTSLTVELAMRHPWVADLVFKLVGPGGAPVVTLMSRPSIDETADDGTRRSGNNANLDPASPIRFISGATVSAEDMGDGIGDGTVCAADRICDFAANAGAATAGDLMSFVGRPASGAWRFCVGDAAPADIGEIDSVTLVMELGR